MKISTPLLVIAIIVIGVTISFVFSGLSLLEGQQQQTTLGFHRNNDSGITDAVGDARPQLQQNRSSIVPEAQDYHDIVAASVKTLEGPSFLLTIILAGNPNLNEKYQTTYAWHIITNSADGQEQLYTVAFSNFPSGYTNVTEPGWYYAVFNNTDGSLELPYTRTWDMPEDRIEFPVEDFYIGSPSEFRYWVASYVRVSNTNFGSIPDYLMDDAPPITGEQMSDSRLRSPLITT